MNENGMQDSINLQKGTAAGCTNTGRKKRMRFVVDTHTHSLSSGHAYSTIQEMAREAKANGIGMFAVTDHGPAMPGAPFLYHFGNLKAVPSELYGTRVIKGAEANIVDYAGRVDIPDEFLERLDFVMASFHDVCIVPASIENHTNAFINIMQNPYIDAVAHPGNPQFQVDIERIVKAAKDYNKLIEINNHSFEASVRAGSEKNCREFALMCKKHGTRIVCGSDAHISFDIGRFDRVYKMLEELEIPEELILNTSMEKFAEYLVERRRF